MLRCLTPGLVYVAGWAPDEGESVAQLSAEHPARAAANLVPDSDGFLWIKPDKFHESFSQDLSKQESFVMAVTQKAPVASTAGGNITDPAWKLKDTWYQISTEDRMIDPDLEKIMASRMNARAILKLDSSHASLASHPKEVARFIMSAVGNQGH